MSIEGIQSGVNSYTSAPAHSLQSASNTTRATALSGEVERVPQPASPVPVAQAARPQVSKDEAVLEMRHQQLTLTSAASVPGSTINTSA